MIHRTANYTAFYVQEPFSESNLGAYATHDFVYYRQLRVWKKSDNSFPFVDAHEKTYSVRDDSQWSTLCQRLHCRLNLSKNIILFLSSATKNSRALSEEMEYGIKCKGLPVIVLYPEIQSFTMSDPLQKLISLWRKLPTFCNNIANVATLHIPYKKHIIEAALKDKDFQVQYMTEPGVYYYDDFLNKRQIISSQYIKFYL